MVATGGKIFATDYNSIRTSVSGVLSSAYGQTLRSSALTGTVDSVTQAQWEDLYLDAQSAYVHQQGSAYASLAVPSVGYTVGADASQTFNQTTGARSTPANGSFMGVNDYTGIVTAITSFNGATSGFPIGNLSVGTATTSTRSTAWGGTTPQAIYHVVTATFASVSQMDYYFNAGGEIRFTASLTSGSGSKDTDWANLLTAIGTVKFDKWELTASSGTPTPSGSGGSGYDSLTSSYRQLFIKSGSGVYADNDYKIEGFKSGAVLRFRITFNDGDVGTSPSSPVDESVGGTTTSNVIPVRPDSSFIYNAVTETAVSLAAPTIANQVLLTANNVSPPA
jgi:hypothetical protein